MCGCVHASSRMVSSYACSFLSSSQALEAEARRANRRRALVVMEADKEADQVILLAIWTCRRFRCMICGVDILAYALNMSARA